LLDDLEKLMNPLMRRIAIHGGMAAIFLGVIGLMFAEMASVWIAASLPTRGAMKAAAPDTGAIRFRLPLLMASSGFAFVAIGELVLHRIRKNRANPGLSQQPTPNETERLLNELIAKEEAKAANSQGTVAPAAPSSENTTTPTSTPADQSTGGR
jgi:hypothetical protein